MTLQPVKTGVAFGLLLALFHTAWATLVALGAAQLLVDFILKIHFIDLAVKIAPFDPGLALTLVLITGAMGFAIGALFAWLWNLVLRPATARGAVAAE